RKAVESTVAELVAAGILARPVYHLRRTGQTVRVLPDEARAAEVGDLPTSVLARIGSRERDGVVVHTYREEAERWGKTLIFAPDTQDADRLGELLQADGVEARVLHTKVVVDRSEVLAWFRQATGPVVLVSVGMLTEGVDLPDARTAFIARPTASYILM